MSDEIGLRDWNTSKIRRILRHAREMVDAGNDEFGHYADEIELLEKWIRKKEKEAKNETPD